MDQAEVKKLAIEANGETWKYLQQASLKKDERVQMLATAYSSLYLWMKAGGSHLHLARGNWLINRVLCVLGEKSLAEHHALLCAAYTEMAQDKKDFDLIYSLECQARTAALLGEKTKAKIMKEKVLNMATKITDPDDKRFLDGDIASEPWFGV